MPHGIATFGRKRSCVATASCQSSISEDERSFARLPGGLVEHGLGHVAVGELGAGEVGLV